MSTAQASIGDWLALYKVTITPSIMEHVCMWILQTAYNAIHIGELCRTLPKEIGIFNKVHSLVSSFTNYKNGNYRLPHRSTMTCTG